MALSALEAQNAKACGRDYKIVDSNGLYLFVSKAGGKSWRYKYRFGGKEKLLTLGRFPTVSLAAARKRKDWARSLIADGRDPAVEAEKEKKALIVASGTTFRSVGEAWYADERPGWSGSHAVRVSNRLEKDIYPEFGRLPVSQIDSPMILAALRKIELRGSVETARRVRGYVEAIFDRAIGESLIDGDTNPAVRVAKGLKKPKKGAKQPALTQIPLLIELQRDVDRSTSNILTKLASRLLALTLVRVGVVIGATWDEFEGIDWDKPDSPSPNAVWRISAARMKLEVDDKQNEAFGHDVSLTRQAVDVLRAIHLISGMRDLVFPGDKSWRIPMSDAAISTMYKRMRGGGYKGRMVPHGWRSAFSTIMNERAAELERDGDRLIIDTVLAHVPRGMSASEWAYNRARYFKPRARLLRVWCDMISEGVEDPMIALREARR
jgi:integrase